MHTRHLSSPFRPRCVVNSFAMIFQKSATCIKRRRAPFRECWPLRTFILSYTSIYIYIYTYIYLFVRIIFLPAFSSLIPVSYPHVLTSMCPAAISCILFRKCVYLIVLLAGKCIARPGGLSSCHEAYHSQVISSLDPGGKSTTYTSHIAMGRPVSVHRYTWDRLLAAQLGKLHTLYMRL